jgi:hypothetical protein
MKQILGDFNAKVVRNDIFKPRIWRVFNYITSDTRVRVPNSAATRNSRHKYNVPTL